MKTYKKRIIVTADDYGMCEIVDKAIDSGIENGIITTTNVMLNMGSLENASTLRERYPNLSIGIHWNVTTGKPVSNPKEVPTLVDSNGMFWEITEFKRKFQKNKISKDDLIRELEAQYTLFECTCGKPDYWNTHENSALELKAFYIFADVAKKHGINATRTFQRVYYDKVEIGWKREMREFLVKIFFEVWFSTIRKEFRMPQARIVSFDKISKLEDGILLNALLADKHDLIEVVFHPALEAESPYFGNISTERVNEYKFVSSERIKKEYLDSGIVFVNYSALL